MRNISNIIKLFYVIFKNYYMISKFVNKKESSQLKTKSVLFQ